MGHNIEHYSFSENVDRRYVAELMNRQALEEGDSISGLCNPIRWHDRTPPLASREEAEEFIKRVDNQYYDQLAVRYLVPDKGPRTKKLDGLRDKEAAARTKWRDASAKIHYQGIASKFVSCKKCGSKLSTEYIRTNYCPLCKTDLRPDTVKSRIQALEQAVKEAHKRVRDEEDALAKSKAKAKVMWLVKIEYHS